MQETESPVLPPLRSPGIWTSLLLVLFISAVTGALTAFFLQSLDFATRLFWQHPWLLYGLPLGGAAVAFIYQRWGGNADKGTDLILNEIRNHTIHVPLRLAPLVLLGTLVTHLFGGSAGREGTAVQMGGGVAGGLARRLRLGSDATSLMLRCGMAAGFGAVFGTPLGGAIFAVEVVRTGLPRLGWIIPVLAASFLGDRTCQLLGAVHSHFHVGQASVNPLLIGKVVAAALAFGLAARLFAQLHHVSKKFFTSHIRNPVLRPVAGALIVMVVAWVTGAHDCLGLGVERGPQGGASILAAFTPGGADSFDWLKKTVLTVLTVGSGFKGGEVTPLFFVGSTLGNALSLLLSAPPDLFAALGFIAVFAAASKTPLACTVMGAELFGTDYALLFLVTCYVARILSGGLAIYAGPSAPPLRA